MSNKEKFFAILQDNTYGVIPAPTPAQLALYVLCDYILGEDFYVGISMNQEQANTIIVDTILRRQSVKYHKDMKKYTGGT